ncbi:MAG: PepSY domain-containing protein [Gammaproteobacteria bacterium]
MKTENPARRKPHPFGLLHRYGGIFSAVLIIFICLTGITLNHTDKLRLGRITVDSEWLLNAYGIEVPAINSFAFTDVTISQVNTTLYLDTTPLEGDFNSVQGVINTGDSIIIATTDSLIWLTPEGDIIEILESYTGLPSGISRIGLLAGLPVLATADGLQLGDKELLSWTKTNNISNADWSTASTLSDNDQNQISQHFRGQGLTLERVILDLHSGRILGSYGSLLADLVAIVFILLALSGVWMWFKTRPKKT